MFFSSQFLSTSYSTDIPIPTIESIHERHLSVDESDDQVAALAFDPLDKTLVSLGGSRWFRRRDASFSIDVRFSGREGVSERWLKKQLRRLAFDEKVSRYTGIISICVFF